ncbi:MAG: AgmX/PglI C-terminal domain-containing protein [Myxococcales bacterium]|nr:MAG: AgmX/PglI C-terminal domain-containing protein [Myxococcales bacterium]
MKLLEKKANVFEKRALNIAILWNDDVLYAEHLRLPNHFVLSSSDTEHPKFVSPEGLIKDESLSLLHCDPDGSFRIVIPEEAFIEHAPLDMPEGKIEQQVSVSPRDGEHLAFRLDEICFHFSLSDGAQHPLPLNPIDWRATKYSLASLLFHFLLVMGMWLMPPSSSSLAIELLSPDSALVDYVHDANERETEHILVSVGHDNASSSAPEAMQGDAGQLGRPDEKAKSGRAQYHGQGSTRLSPMLMAESAGILGVLLASTGALHSSDSPYAKDRALGIDAETFWGSYEGVPGTQFGFNGLGPHGTGIGGGGDANGSKPLARIGGLGNDGGGDYGLIRGTLDLKGRQSHAPRVSSQQATVTGTLSKEVIRRVVRRNINTVRYCYEQTLRERPDLEGRITMRFVIAEGGSVISADVLSRASDIQHTELSQCMSESIRRWNFPQPEGGGVVIVSYPFMFASGG